MSGDNGLHKVAAGGAALVGTFLVLGAYGHFEAVWPAISRGGKSGNAMALALPGVILVFTGVFSVALCKSLWDGRRMAVDAALAINTLALVYLVYLLLRGVPGHPVGLFTGIVACNVTLLAATRAGLVWPAPKATIDKDTT